jgi:hypothetical protein
MAERTQRRRHRRAGTQRDFALGARAAQHDNDVQFSRHFISRKGAKLQGREEKISL